MNDGPADIDDVTQYVQRNTNAKKRTVANAVNHDPENRFIHMDDRRIAANPILYHCNLDGPAITVIPDGRRQGPVLRESELAWLTHFVRCLTELAPPLPRPVALTGPGAAGFTHEGGTLEVTVVAESRDRPSLEPRLTELAAAASEAEPAIRPQVSILSPDYWGNQEASERPRAFYNVWLAPDAAP